MGETLILSQIVVFRENKAKQQYYLKCQHILRTLNYISNVALSRPK